MESKTRTRSIAAVKKEDLIWVYDLMVRAREMDEAEIRLRRQVAFQFQLSCSGHAADQDVAAQLLRPGKDWFYPYYRDRTFVYGLGRSPADLFRQPLGKRTDPSSGGRQMPNHFAAPELNIVSQSSPTGTQFLQAVGTAEVKKLVRSLPPNPSLPPCSEDEVVYVSAGDGATSQGELYEAISAASLNQLPVLFVIQDNGYAISVPTEVQTPGGSISRTFSDFPGLFVRELDGVDVLDCFAGLGEAVANCRSGKGPALVHANVVRLKPHSDSDDDASYRCDAEKEADLERDPLPIFEKILIDAGIIDSSDGDRIRQDAHDEFQDIYDVVKEEEMPDGSTVSRFIYNPATVVDKENEPVVGGEKITMVAGINKALATEMQRDPRVVVFGEDVADCSREENLAELKGKGGVFKVTQDLQRNFGSSRVYNVPIAEAGIVGRAIGMAVRGMRPVVEIQFFDYIWPAMNQIRSELALMRWRSNNAYSCPVVIRCPTGGYVRGGAIYHSQSAESMFCQCPGLRVVMPSNARDAIGLLRTAMRCGDPVLYLEHKHLYRQQYTRAPDPGSDYTIPLGKATTVRKGEDVTVVTYGAQVQKSLEAARQLSEEGFEVEVIDLRSLQPYDWEAISSSTRRTGRLVVVYEENRSFGFGAEIAARAAQELFGYLDAPVMRVAAKDTYVGFAQELVDACLPQVDDISEVLRRSVRF
ncbi:MAG: thiamine pyrophosphate-dependent enzyme [Planctomycetes bacterium]|nr:thiamine pyrophosphate-dependent enzyme [Planctomycetota bacterium]